jgi:hypothetical protein
LFNRLSPPVTGQAEEIIMVPHQIYQVLADQRTRELKASAARHERTAGAQVTGTERSSRLKDAVAHLGALVHVRRGGATSTTTSSSPTGPMGCLA